MFFQDKSIAAPFETLAAAAGTLLNTRSSFQPTKYVWSRGLALLCDHNGGLKFVRRQRGGHPAMQFEKQAYANIKNGDLVWVRSFALPQFVNEVLPSIRARFALITGDEDWAIPSGFDRADEIIANPNVVCWFSQNFDGTDRSGKIFPIPIGMDYHTISNGPRWGHRQATPAQQERDVELLRVTMPANDRRLVRVHADFHFQIHKRQLLGDRREVVQATLADNPNVDFEPEKVKRSDLWRNRTRYAFVVSPHGNGLDCHRTWESLALDNIVIVKRSSLDPLYEGLPVVIVQDWNEITSENLQHWQALHCKSFEDKDVQERLTNRYWIARVRQVLAERMTTTE
jgi:hypothetical protein